jgi:hypothetical protein
MSNRELPQLVDDVIAKNLYTVKGSGLSIFTVKRSGKSKSIWIRTNWQPMTDNREVVSTQKSDNLEKPGERLRMKTMNIPKDKHQH